MEQTSLRSTSPRGAESENGEIQTTEAIQRHEEPQAAPTRAINVFSDKDAFEASQRMAKALSSSALIPVAYQGNIPNCMIALELAHRIGASPLMVMQCLDVIHGRPSWRSQFLIATVNSSRRFTPIRFRFEGSEGKDDWGCRAWAKDRDTGEECVGSLITIALAKSEGWYGKQGSKWKTMPEQMLMYRAAAFWTRIYAPELSLGMHTAEEVIDMGKATVLDARPLPTNIAPGDTEALQASLMESDQEGHDP
jgi:hypothetical protein